MERAPGPESTDAALIEIIRLHGSETAFRVLYDRHTAAAFRGAWRILGNRHDAEEATQEAWARALGALAQWRGNSSFGAWLRSIAVNVAIDQVRKSARFDDEVDEGAPQISGDADDRIDMHAAIISLPPGYRAVLVLHDIEGFTHEEIGRHLGITAGTSKGQLFKARRAVRARLGAATARNA